MLSRKVALILIVLLAVLASLPSTSAQSDPQTDDWSRQDRLYQERMKRQQKEAEEPPLSQEEFRQAYIEKANRLIHDRNYQVKKSEHYMVRTDDPRLDLSACTALLEHNLQYFLGFWKDRADPTQMKERSEVYLFYSYYKYNKVLTGEARFGTFRPAGHYRRGLDVITLHSDGSPLSELAGSLVHEATHQLAEKTLFPDEPPRPVWLDEGLASWFQFSGLKAMGGAPASLVKTGKVPRSTAARRMLRELRSALRNRKEPFSILSLLELQDPRDFYGGPVGLHYAASWALVDYLLTGENGRYRDFVLDGGTGPLPATLGMDETAFETRFKEHVRKMNP